MKKFLSIILAIVLVLSALPMGLFNFIVAATGINYDDFDIYDGVLVEYLGPGGDVVIPSRDADGNPVMSIGENAFEHCTGLKTVFFATNQQKAEFLNCFPSGINADVNSATLVGDSTVAAGNNIELTINVSGFSEASSVAVAVTHSDEFELVSGEWLKGGSLADFDITTRKGVLGGLNSSDVNGNLFKLVLKAKTYSANLQNISVNVIAKNGSNETMNVTAEKSVKIICASHTYDHGCDPDCNVCGETRKTSHKYSGNCDASCNVCKATRTVTHSYKTNITKATTSKNGKIVQICSDCGKMVISTIYYADSFSLSATNFTYNGKVRTPAVTVKDANGNVISSKYYTVSYPDDAKSSGTYKVKVTLKGNYSGSKTLSYKIAPTNISRCRVSISDTSYVYDGNAKTPTITVKTSSGVVLKNGTDYVVSYPSGRIDVGAYKVTVKMKGNYSGRRAFTFKILPPETSISKVTAELNAMKVDVTKATAQVTGYEIQYATVSDFADAITQTITSYDTTSATISGLKSGATYYVRVRTYKTVNGVNYYSGWSLTESVKTSQMSIDDNEGWIPGWY